MKDDTIYSILYEIDSRLECVSMVGISMAALCKHYDIDETICFQMETCAIEAINNAIIHAYEKKTDRKVWIEWSLQQNVLTISVIDNGIAMSQAIPNTLVNPEKESGRGWFIMKQWTDSIDYSSSNGKNTVTLRKILNQNT